MGYNYRYTVTYWSDCDGCEIIETGFVCGDTYADAAKRLATVYGENDIMMETLAYFDDCAGVIADDILGLSDELIKAHAEKVIKTAGGFANGK